MAGRPTMAVPKLNRAICYNRSFAVVTGRAA